MNKNSVKSFFKTNSKKRELRTSLKSRCLKYTSHNFPMKEVQKRNMKSFLFIKKVTGSIADIAKVLAEHKGIINTQESNIHKQAIHSATRTTTSINKNARKRKISFKSILLKCGNILYIPIRKRRTKSALENLPPLKEIEKYKDTLEESIDDTQMKLKDKQIFFLKPIRAKNIIVKKKISIARRMNNRFIV